MSMEWEYVLPTEIEGRSFEIIDEEIGESPLPAEYAPVIKRVIHTTADFDYIENLVFSDGVIEKAKAALKKGAYIVTDTQMAMAGVNKKALAKLDGQAYCFMPDADIAAAAAANHTTRAVACMDKAAKLKGREIIVAIGNAPTALRRVYELVQEGVFLPAVIIGAPVGFVNVVQSKEWILSLDIPSIVARGRKGGSTVAAAILNALLYETLKEL